MRVVNIILLLVPLSIKETTAQSSTCAKMATCMRDHPFFRCSESGWYQSCDGRCMKYYSNPLSFDEAEAACQKENAHLVSAHNKNENNEILCLILMAARKEVQIWIGGRRQDNGKFGWLDGSNFHFANWAAGQPDFTNEIEKCLHLNWRKWGEWNDLTCANRMPFICARVN